MAVLVLAVDLPVALVPGRGLGNNALSLLSSPSSLNGLLGQVFGPGAVLGLLRLLSQDLDGGASRGANSNGAPDTLRPFGNTEVGVAYESGVATEAALEFREVVRLSGMVVTAPRPLLWASLD